MTMPNQARLGFSATRIVDLAWLPIPIVVFLLVALQPLQTGPGFASPWLLLAVNLVFGTVLSGAVAYLIAHVLARRGELWLLAIACGAFFWSIAGSMGAIAALLGPGGFNANTTVTIFTGSVFLSALCHLVGAAIPTHWRSPARLWPAWLAAALALCVTAVFYLVDATLTGSLPAFFAADYGGTLERRWALFASAAMLALTAALFWNRGTRTRFHYWYSLALLLIAVALVGLSFIRELWSVYAWACRLGTSLGSCYLLAAALHARHEPTPLSDDDSVPYGPRYPYVIAIVVVVAATVARMIFLSEMGAQSAFVLFYPAVTLAAVYGGFGPGALATALSIPIAAFNWMPPAAAIDRGDSSGLAGIILYALASLLVCALSATLHRALRRSLSAEAELARRGERLEELVALRTAELTREVARCQQAQASAEAANAARTRFVAAVSHDLRQPLGALSLYVAAAAMRAEKDDRLVANMGRCVSNLTEMLDHLLDLSKLDAAVVKAECKDFALAPLLEQIVVTHQPQAAAKGLTLRCRASDFVAHSDPVLFGRIISNLVANAVRYTARGGVLIGLRRAQGKCWLEVHDTGIGIPEDQTECIFEEFRQLGNAERNRENGSGLGLAIVAKTAALLGLTVRLRSRLGVGTMFAIEVPGADRIGERGAAQPGRALKIAVVEDDRSMLDALLFALERGGHEVIAAHGSAELADKAPDIVISDYALADGETGLDVVRALRARFGAHMPAILLTGNTDPQLKAAAVTDGIVVHYKPVDFIVLQRSIDELAGHGTKRRAALEA